MNNNPYISARKDIDNQIMLTSDSIIAWLLFHNPGLGKEMVRIVNEIKIQIESFSVGKPKENI